MDQLGYSEVVPRVIDVCLPAELCSDMLDLHPDLSHFSPEFVIHQFIGRVLDDVTTAEGVLSLEGCFECGFEVASDLVRKLFALLTEHFMGRFFRCRVCLIEVKGY